MSGLLSTVTWDPVGRMASVLHGATTVDDQHDGEMLVAEYVGAARFRRHIHGPGVDEPVAFYYSSGVGGWPLADHLGSIVGFSDNAGALTAAAASRMKSGNGEMGTKWEMGTVTICGRNQQVASRALDAANKT